MVKMLDMEAFMYIYIRKFPYGPHGASRLSRLLGSLTARLGRSTHRNCRQILPRGRRWLEMAARACPGAAAGSKVLLEAAPEPPCARKCCSSLAGPRNGVETRVSLTLCLCRTRQLKKIYIYIYIYIYISKYREALRASPATVPF